MRSTRSWPFFERRSVDGAWNRFLIAHLQPALIGAGWKYRHLGNTKRKKIVIPGQHHKTIHVSSWFHLSEDFEAGRNADKNQQNAYIIEGSLEVKLPTIWTDEKQSREEAERRERLEERRVRRKKMQMREKVGKSRNCVFPMIWGSGGSKSRLAKAAGVEPAG